MRHPVQPFIISLATLMEGSNRIRLEGSPSDVGIDPVRSDLRETVVLEGDLYRSEWQVEIQARVQARVRQSCGRCLAPIDQGIAAPLRLLCERRGDRDRRSDTESRAEDVGLMYYDGRTLDLREEIREVILLEVPWHPLCSPGCKGLCPRCGCNRNEGDCGCHPHRGMGPWDILRTTPGEGAASSDDSRS